MSYCDFCNQETGFLPFKCNYCGGKFCNTHRLPENHACNFDIEHKIQVQSEKQHRWLVTRRLKQKRIVSTRRIVGVYYLYLLIFIPSIIAFLYPHYLSISYRTFYYYPFPFMWTLISSIFIISFVNIFELIYFLTLLFFAYYFLKVIEASHGPKFLLSLFLLFAILTGGFNLFMSMFGISLLFCDLRILYWSGFRSSFRTNYFYFINKSYPRMDFFEIWNKRHACFRILDNIKYYFKNYNHRYQFYLFGCILLWL